ncbi:MAG: phosphotransferase [Gammaproteobacteria bacterium]|jgi:aminoglycoside phosphotransferase (APT) family kinase protein|nr:phosphotransferase [Gammaproteobacteria bacterium]MBT4494827.1 phosphotransferase [Gammaproteobacteria bacterium]MBT7370139.1 phosphotransferase [Gammaproteobacteria bacterium]
MAEFNPEDNIGTIPIQEKHQFEVANLQTFMEENVAGFSGTLTVEEFAGGQSNPTYLLSAGAEQYVMRRKPPGTLLKSAHAVDREYKVMTALFDTDVPVAKTYALCTDDDVIGTWFYIMEYLDGRVIWDSTSGAYTPEERGEMWDTANDVLARLHNVDYEAVGLSDFGKHGEYVTRQLSRWAGQYEYTKTVEDPYMDNLIDYLSKNIPEEDKTSCSIVHGDPKIDNMMMHKDRNEVIGILDWELSTLGNPISDFAYICMRFRDSLRGVDLKSLGIPNEEEYVEAYCRRTGRSGIENWDYYIAFNMFRLAAILQGIAKRVQDGTAAGQNAEEAGSGALELSKLAWAQIDSSVKID